MIVIKLYGINKTQTAYLITCYVKEMRMMNYALIPVVLVLLTMIILSQVEYDFDHLIAKISSNKHIIVMDIIVPCNTI